MEACEFLLTISKLILIANGHRYKNNGKDGKNISKFQLGSQM